MNCKGRTRCFSDLLTVTQGYFCAGRPFLFSCLFVCLFVCLFLYLNFYFPELPNTLLLPSSYTLLSKLDLQGNMWHPERRITNGELELIPGICQTAAVIRTRHRSCPLPAI